MVRTTAGCGRGAGAMGAETAARTIETLPSGSLRVGPRPTARPVPRPDAQGMAAVSQPDAVVMVETIRAAGPNEATVHLSACSRGPTSQPAPCPVYARSLRHRLTPAGPPLSRRLTHMPRPCRNRRHPDPHRGTHHATSDPTDRSDTQPEPAVPASHSTITRDRG